MPNDAVDSYHSPGSGHAEYQYLCRIRLTRLHTHTVWANWLAPPESRVPEPELPTGG